MRWNWMSRSGEGVPQQKSEENPSGWHDDGQAESTEVEFELKGVKLAFVISGLCLAIFLMAVDTSIIGTAIPKITSQFGSTDDIAWYGSAYSFALCALQPLGGKLFSNFSLKAVFVAFLTTFLLGSLLCGVATNSKMLIVGRAISGLGASGIATGTLSIVAASIPLRKRPIYIAIIQSIFGFATIAGPVLGGVLTQHASWRWCFFINLPIGAPTILSLLLFFHPPNGLAKKEPVRKKLAKLDLIGSAIFMPAVIMLLLATQWGGNTYSWSSPTVIGLFCGFGALTVVFVFWQIRQKDDAMIPPRLMKQRTMLSVCVAAFLAMGAILIVAYYMPEWFQVVKGVSPVKSGLMYLAVALAEILAANLSGVTIMLLGYYTQFMLIGTIMMSVATGLFTTFKMNTSHQHWIPYQVIQGLGSGMTVAIPAIATQTVLEAKDIPTGNAIVMLFQFLGASISLAVSQAIFSNKLTSSLSKLDNIGIGPAEIQRILAAGSSAVRTVVTADQLPDVLRAYNLSITSTFYVASAACAAAFFAALCIEWKSVKGKSLIPGG